MYEAVLFDGSGECMYRGEGSTVHEALASANTQMIAAYNDECTKSGGHIMIKDSQRSALPTDVKFKNLRAVPEHTNNLLIIVAWDRMTMAEGFVRPING